MHSFSKWKTRLKPGSQFRDLKYSLLGINKPQILQSDGIAGFQPAKSWTESDTLTYLRQTRVLAQNVISTLAGMSDLSQKTVPLPQIRVGLRQPPTILKSLPDNSSSSQAVNQTVETLTKYDYGPTATAIINKWLYRLANQREVLSIQPINCMIGYFVKLNDLQMVNHWVKYMFSRNISPNRVTLHLLLSFQARKIPLDPYPKGNTLHPLITTVNTLNYMHRAGVQADIDTWNLVLLCMPFGYGKSFMVEEMDRRKIPLDSRSIAMISRIIAENKKIIDSSSQSVDFSPNSLLHCIDPQDHAVLRTVISHLLSTKAEHNLNVTRAWELVLQSSPLDVSTDTMNTFLKSFAGRAHLDWQFGILSHFATTEWNELSWQYYLEAASFTRENPQKYVILGTILKQMEREQVCLTSRSRVLARRALRQAQKSGHELKDLGQTGWDLLRENLKWIKCFKPKSFQFLAEIGFSHDRAHLPTRTAELDQSQFKKVERTDSPEQRQKLFNELQTHN